MATFAVIIALISGGLDAGGRVGIAFPTGGISRTVRSATVVGVQAGYRQARSRIGLGYSYFIFPGRFGSPYEIRVHELALTYEYEIFHRQNWGVCTGAGAGYGFVERSFNTGRERGRTPDVHLLLQVVQHEGKSRVSAGLDNILFGEGRSGRLAVTYVPMLRVEVGYAF